MRRVLILVLLCHFVVFAMAQQSATPYTGAVINEVTVVQYVEKEVTVISNVPAIRVIDEDTLPVASVEKYTLRCGKHHFLLQAEGYFPIELDIVLTPSGPTELIYTLIPSQRDITIVTNIPTERIFDNQQCGESEVETYTMPCGYHTLVLNANGYYSRRSKLKILPDGKDTYKYTLFKKQAEWKNIALVHYGYGANNRNYDTQHSLGFTYGRVKNFGWYVNMMFGAGMHYGYSYVADNSDKINNVYPLYTGRISHNRFSITGGGMVRLIVPLYFYAGIGYGHKSVTREIGGGDWAYADSRKLMSFGHCMNWDFGLIGHYNGYTISLGYSALTDYKMGEMHEVKIGLGYTFKDLR